MRLWNLNTRENLLTLFHGSNGEWVAWTPSGHYTSSPNGDNMIGWQINRGVDKAADYVEAAQLRDKFYRPELVANAVRLRSAKQALAQAKRTDFSVAQLAKAKPPGFEIVSPKNNSRTRYRELPLLLSFAETKNPVKTIQVYVNGKQVLTRGKIWLPQRKNRYRKTVKIFLEPGDNQIQIIAKNRVGKTTKDWQVYFQSYQQTQKRGDLYLVAVGVSDYQADNLDLKYAAADARAFHRALLKQKGKAYKKLHSILLADRAEESPTADNIQDAVDLFAQAGKDDTVILFLAGHGVNEDGQYYFLPREAKQRWNRWRKSTVIKWRVLQDALEESQGQRLLFVDTCHAGNAFNARLVKEAAEAKIVVISATDSDSFARELPELQHGVFTYALLEGLKGKADYNGDKFIKIKELDNYLSDRMERLTDGHQLPVLHAPGGFKNFVLARR